MTKQSSKKPRFDKDHLPTFDEAYRGVKHVLAEGNTRQRNKMWKILNEGKGDWIWLRVKLITDLYESADAKGREEFCLIGIKEQVKKTTAKLLKEVFTDPETGI